MFQEEKEAEHTIEVIEQVKLALNAKDSIQLKSLSNQTVHNASLNQDPGNLTLAVIIYTLSKLIDRQDYKKIKNWDKSISKLNSLFSLTIKAARDKNQRAYDSYLLKARKLLESISNLKPYIHDVLRKSAINKGSKIYEHGISLEQTSRLLGITQWELSEYVGQKNLPDIEENRTTNTKQRAKMALEFFS